MILNFEQIKELLPQRFPFLMLDRVVEYEPGKRIIAVKNVSGNEIFFQGHFPQEAIMPGALILEAMAQTAIIFFKLSNPNQGQGSLPFLFGGVKARFLKPVIPGDVIKIEMLPIRIIPTGGMMEGKASVNEVVVTKAELTFSAKGE